MLNNASQNSSRASSRQNSTNSTASSRLRQSVDGLREAVQTGERQISISSNRPATALLATDHILDPTHKNPLSKCCGMTLSGNSKTLIISTILFLSITTGQYFAAIIANSVTLKADCVSMLVDALSYIGNLFAECTPRPRSKKRLELIMSGVSFALLLYFTTDFIIECWGNIYHKDCLCGADDPFSADPADDKDCHLDQDTEKTCEPEEEVNAYIVMGFALGGLLFDILSLYAYKYFSSDKGDEHAHHHHPGDKPLSHHHGEEHAGHNVNMLSALMHVFSDLLRSTTTFVESLVLLNYPNISGEVVDGWCGLVVCILIALGAVYSLAVWIMEVYSYCTDEEDEEEEDPANFYKQLGDVADV